MNTQQIAEIFSATRQAEVTNLLYRAHYALREDGIQALLPPAYHLRSKPHDTGYQPVIYVEANNLPPFDVWAGSTWRSPNYEFNDRAKVLGIKEGAGFAERALADFFHKVETAIKAKEEAEASLKAAAELNRIAERVALSNAYARLTGEPESNARESQMDDEESRDRCENDEGVHVMMGEYTLCGDAFDIHDTELSFEHGPLKPTRKRLVSCPRCIGIVRTCKAVRIDPAAEA